MEYSKAISPGIGQGIAAVMIALVILLANALLTTSEIAGKQFSASPRHRVSVSPVPSVPASVFEYLWYEAENMRGLTQTSQYEPQLNPSYLEIPAKAPGWSISGPGVSAEWSQGGESEWNSVAASADETRAT